MGSVYPNLWKLLLQQADNYHNKPVITFGDEKMGFDELCEKVKMVAAFLDGQTSKNIIGISSAHPFKNTISVLGSLVAQKAFWVLNSSLAERVHSSVLEEVFMFDESAYQKALSTNASLQIVDSINEKMTFCWVTSSGSLAAPKITEHSYYSIMEDTYRQIRDHKITANDRIDVLASLTFSATLSAIFPAVFTGASLHIKRQTKNIADVYDFWKSEKITITTLAPSMLRVILKLPFNFKDLSLRFVCVGGEKVLTNDFMQFQKRFEASVIFQAALASSETRSIAEFIGRASDRTPLNKTLPYSLIENKKILILDENFKEIANGELGRIAVQSKIIGSRYITSRDHFSQLPNDEHFFISDDYATLMPDGKMYVADRYSRLMKLKGEYVDLDRIESLILKEKDINECFATLNEAQSELHLFVYCLLSKSVLKERINSLLNYQAFQLHLSENELPKLHSGKLDVKTLKENLITEADFGSIANRQEALLTQVWRSIFPKERRFEERHFFNDLGGDSIQALEFVVKACEIFEKEFEPSIVFLYPTFNEQMEFIHKTEFFHLKLLNKAGDSSENILIFPVLSGTYHHYSTLIEALKEKYNFYLLIHPTQENNESLSILDISKKNADFLKLQTVKFSSFIGHSFAGLIAYTTAAYTKSQDYVFLIDTPIYERENIVGGSFRFVVRNSKLAIRILRFSASNLFDFSKMKTGGKLLHGMLRNRVNKNNPRTKDYKVEKHSKVYSKVVENKIILPTSDFSLGLFVASEQDFFKYKIAPNYSWEKYNANIAFKHVIKGNHSNIVHAKNMQKIALILKDYLALEVDTSEV